VELDEEDGSKSVQLQLHSQSQLVPLIDSPGKPSPCWARCIGTELSSTRISMKLHAPLSGPVRWQIQRCGSVSRVVVVSLSNSHGDSGFTWI
jgi:hypothetical protein